MHGLLAQSSKLFSQFTPGFKKKGVRGIRRVNLTKKQTKLFPQNSQIKNPTCFKVTLGATYTGDDAKALQHQGMSPESLGADGI